MLKNGSYKIGGGVGSDIEKESENTIIKQ